MKRKKSLCLAPNTLVTGILLLLLTQATGCGRIIISVYVVDGGSGLTLNGSGVKDSGDGDVYILTTQSYDNSFSAEARVDFASRTGSLAYPDGRVAEVVQWQGNNVQGVIGFVDNLGYESVLAYADNNYFTYGVVKNLDPKKFSRHRPSGLSVDRRVKALLQQWYDERESPSIAGRSHSVWIERMAEECSNLRGKGFSPGESVLLASEKCNDAESLLRQNMKRGGHTDQLIEELIRTQKNMMKQALMGK